MATSMMNGQLSADRTPKDGESASNSKDKTAVNEIVIELMGVVTRFEMWEPEPVRRKVYVSDISEINAILEKGRIENGAVRQMMKSGNIAFLRPSSMLSATSKVTTESAEQNLDSPRDPPNPDSSKGDDQIKLDNSVCKSEVSMDKDKANCQNHHTAASSTTAVSNSQAEKDGVEGGNLTSSLCGDGQTDRENDSHQSNVKKPEDKLCTDTEAHLSDGDMTTDWVDGEDVQDTPRIKHGEITGCNDNSQTTPPSSLEASAADERAVATPSAVVTETANDGHESPATPTTVRGVRAVFAGVSTTPVSSACLTQKMSSDECPSDADGGETGNVALTASSTNNIISTSTGLLTSSKTQALLLSVTRL